MRKSKITDKRLHKKYIKSFYKNLNSFLFFIYKWVKQVIKKNIKKT